MAVSGINQSAQAAPGQSARQLAALRGNSFGALAMLIVQFAIGIAVNLYVTVPAADRGSGTVGAIGRALSNGPAALAVHAGVGLLLVLTAVALAVRSILTRQPLSMVLSVLGLIAIIVAALSGGRFVSAGGPTGASLAMALATAVAMLCYAVNLLVLSFRQPAAR